MFNVNCVMTDQIIYIPINLINLSPYQPRRIFDSDKIMSLAGSIKKYGLLQPICVRFMGEERYELAAGERRLKAAKLAGLDTVPSIVLNMRDRDAAAFTLIENLQRERLDIFEEAAGIERLSGIFGYSVEEIADMLGVGDEFIRDRLELSNLSSAVRDELDNVKNRAETARLLLRIKEEELQLRACREIKRLSPGLNTASRLVNRLIEDPDAKITRQSLKPRIKKYFKDIRIFTATVKKAVDMMNESGAEVEYQTAEDGGKRIITITVNENPSK